MLDLPLGVLSRVERIGNNLSRDVSYGLVCKVSALWKSSRITAFVCDSQNRDVKWPRC